LDVSGGLDVTATTTLSGNVGIGGAPGTEKLLVTGTGRITGMITCSTQGLFYSGRANWATRTDINNQRFYWLSGGA
jgi:hypothetical protein